jgi:phenylacetate-CoA ligase
MSKLEEMVKNKHNDSNCIYENINQAIFSVLENAYRKSSYYQGILSNMNVVEVSKLDYFNKFPILSRETLINEFENILDKEYRYLKRKELQLIQTSGSTGQIVNVLWHPAELMQSNMCLWRYRKKWYDIIPANKQCSFVSGTQIGSTITTSNDSFISRVNNRLDLCVISFNDNTLKKYYEAISEFKPDWIYSSPSALLLFVEYCKKNKLKKISSLKYIELATEQVMNSTYNYIKDYFNVPVSIMYGAKEVNGIALSCPYDNKLHVIQDNVFVEQTEQNEILVTSLKNKIFPIIRYKLGDIVEICYNSSTGEQIIDVIKGRIRQLSYVDNESGITVAAITNALLVANARLGDPFLQYKIFEKNHKFTIAIYLKNEYKNWKSSIEKEIISCCMKYDIDPLKINVLFSEGPFDIDYNTGKLLLFNH